MGKRKFKLTFEVTINLELDDAVIDAVDASWKDAFYDLDSTEDIAKTVGRNLARGIDLSDLDGWADQPDSNAKILSQYWNNIDVYEV